MGFEKGPLPQLLPLIVLFFSESLDEGKERRSRAPVGVISYQMGEPSGSTGTKGSPLQRWSSAGHAHRAEAEA